MSRAISTLLVAFIIAAPNFANALPTIFYEYSQRNTPPYPPIKSIIGVVDLNSVPNQTLLACAPQLLVGVIDWVDNDKRNGPPARFRVRPPTGSTELIDLSPLKKAELSADDLTSLRKFFVPARHVLVSGMRCGASGLEFIPRDIYDASVVSKALASRHSDKLRQKYNPSTKLDAPGATDSNALSQRIADARAMVSQSWEKYRAPIEAIETGYKCGVIDQLSGNVAIRSIQVTMQDELNRAGLIDDPTISVQRFTTAAVQAGKAAAESGACARLTPEWRGRLRSMVSDLMR